MTTNGLDGAVRRVASRKDDWRRLDPAAKLGYLRRLQSLCEANGPLWARTCLEIRGIPDDGSVPHLEGAAWLMGAATFGTCLETLVRSYESYVRGGSLPSPVWRTGPGDRRIATVFPSRLLDRLYAPGYRGEIWLRPGARGERMREFVEGGGGVCGILGAGNYEAPLDVLSKMFVENKVAVYKPNPVNRANGEVLERLFAPLVDDGFLAVIPGGTEEGQALIAHPAVDEILLTGGIRTYDRIMWGAGDDVQRANRDTGARKLSKRFDAELGGVAPVIVLPGQWSERELDHQAAQIVAAKMANAGHICASPQVLVLDKAWPQRARFLERIRYHLGHAPAESTYYPGAAERLQDLFESCPGAERLGPTDTKLDTQLAPVFVPDARPGSPAVQREAFCLALVETSLDAGGGDPSVFAARAAEYCNRYLYGTLSCTVIADPRTQREMGARLDAAIAALRYGTVGVNTAGLTVVLYPPLPWGAYPGHTPEDIQSGVGSINNTWMFEDVEKSVLWSPFVSPAHLQPGSPRDKLVHRRMASYVLRPSYTRVAKLLSAALLGI